MPASYRLFRLPRLLLSRLLTSSVSPNPSPSPNPNPTYPKTLKATINALFKESDPDKLAAGFISASSSPRFRCRHRIYEVSVRRLAGAGRRDAVEAVLESQKLFPSDLSHEGFAVRIISLYGKVGMPSHAAATFDQLPALGCPRTVKSLNALLTAYADACDFDSLSVAFEEIPRKDPSIVPDVYSYNILIRALCEKSDLDAALDVLTLMEKCEIEPNLISFNTLLNGFYKNQRFSEAEKIWSLMRENNVAPDVKSFNAKLRGLVIDGKATEAVELVQKMKEDGLKPDTSSFNTLIRGHITDGNLEEAKRVYLDLVMNDCAPNKGTYEALVPSLCDSGDLDLAVRCCFDSMSRRCFMDAAVLQALVDALVKASREEDATKLVELGRKNKYSRKSLRMPEKCSAT
ncbi:uncharacterized protein [Typha latifolia]|uniref:uncharacterized protein n=1 Tax=Typha latifolia TaxID=4733 RepID=UPI003C2C0022